MRELAERLGGMSAALYRRAAELESGTTPARVVIDARCDDRQAAEVPT